MTFVIVMWTIESRALVYNIVQGLSNVSSFIDVPPLVCTLLFIYHTFVSICASCSAILDVVVIIV